MTNVQPPIHKFRFVAKTPMQNMVGIVLVLWALAWAATWAVHLPNRGAWYFWLWPAFTIYWLAGYTTTHSDLLISNETISRRFLGITWYTIDWRNVGIIRMIWIKNPEASGRIRLFAVQRKMLRTRALRYPMVFRQGYDRMDELVARHKIPIVEKDNKHWVNRTDLSAS
jgi:hypothetical protein